MSENQTILEINNKEEVAFRLYKELLPQIDSIDEERKQQYKIDLFLSCLKMIKQEKRLELPLIPKSEQKEDNKLKYPIRQTPEASWF